MIDAVDHVPRSTIRAGGQKYSVGMAGEGPPVVFIHGSATHAYAWRNVIPYLARGNRCLAPDLAGMGGSASNRFNLVSHSFSSQYAGLETLIETLEPERKIVLVGHELGAMLAAQYARENPNSVAGLAFVEGSFRVTNDETLPPDVRDFLVEVRGVRGDDMILRQNLLIEHYLNRLTLRFLGPEEMRSYREPYSRSGKSRQAMLSMIRELPLANHPGPLMDLAEETRAWCSRSATPKLVVGGSPGFLVPLPILGTTAKWANTTTAVVKGLHFLMEDSPARLTSALLDWLEDIDHTRPHQSITSQDEVDIDAEDQLPSRISR